MLVPVGGALVDGRDLTGFVDLKLVSIRGGTTGSQEEHPLQA